MPAIWRNIVYRREARLGPAHQWLRRHRPLCYLLAGLLGAWSFAEIIGGVLGAAWGPKEIQFAGDVFLLLYLAIGPIALALTMRSDVVSRTAESLIAAGVTPQEYLEGKFFGALRPTFIILFALWVRHLLWEVRFNPNLGVMAGLGEQSLITMHLMYSSVSFFLNAIFFWVLGILCYGAVAMTITLSRRSAGQAILAVLALAALIDVWGPRLLAALPVGRYQDTLIALSLVLLLLSVVFKYALYRWLFDLCEERFGAWALE